MSKRRHSITGDPQAVDMNSTWPLPTTSPMSGRRLSRQWAMENAPDGITDSQLSFWGEEETHGRRFGSSRSGEFQLPLQDLEYSPSNSLRKTPSKNSKRKGKKKPSSARRSGSQPAGSGKKKKAGTGKKKKKKGKGRRKKSRSRSKGPRRRANSQPPRLGDTGSELLGMPTGVASAFFNTPQGSVRGRFDGGASVASVRSMSREELRRHLSGYGLQSPRMLASRTRSPSLTRSHGMPQGNFANHTFGGHQGWESPSHLSLAGLSMGEGSNTSSITWGPNSKRRGRRRSSGNISVLSYAHQSRSHSPAPNNEKRVHTKYYKHDPEKRRNVMKFGSAEQAWEPMYNSVVHKNPIPTASKQWNKHVKKKDSKAWDLETLDTIGTRAYSPVHLLHSKPPSYKHVRSKMWWANESEDRKKKGLSRSGSQGSLGSQNRPKATDWAMFSPRTVSSGRW